MQHLEVSGAVVLYTGRTCLKVKHFYTKNSAFLTVADNRSIHFFLLLRAGQGTVHDASHDILTVRVSDLDFSPTRNRRDCFKSRP
jgi:hypothetical protein